MLRKIQIGVFVGLLVVPTLVWVLFFAGTDENLENRQLASFPNFAEESYDTLFADLDEWYDDHTPFKNYATRLKNTADITLFGQVASTKAIVGKDGWLFLKNSKSTNPIGEYMGLFSYNDKVLESYYGQYCAAKSNLAEQGVDLYMVVAPNKSRAYEQYLPDEIRSGKGTTRTEQLAKFMDDKGEEGFRYFDNLLNTEQNPPAYPTYFQLDSHWNLYGAYLGYRELLDMVGIDKSASDIVFSLETTNEGDLSQMLNLDMVEHNAIVASGLDNSTLVYESKDGSYEVYESTLPEADSRTVLLIGDSYRDNFKGYLAQDFARTVVVHRDSLTDASMLQQTEYSPDIVVLLCPERNIEWNRSVLDILSVYEF